MKHDTTTNAIAQRALRQAAGGQGLFPSSRLAVQGVYSTRISQRLMLEKPSRKRFIYAYEENSSYSTIDFVKRAILFFGYAPKTIQTDNGAAFTHFLKTKRVHRLTYSSAITTLRKSSFVRERRGITARLREATETTMQTQMRRYLRRSNGIPMAVLGWKSPNQKQAELESTCA